MPDPETNRLVELADVDELLRHVDRLCSRRDWDELERVRVLCRAAVERGRQLWPVASHAEYRLALEGDARAAARVLVEGTGRFALGPLTEVAASTHSWAELAPHLEPGPIRSLVAYERVVRGEDLSSDRSIDTSIFELPLDLDDWEPEYPVATYRADKADFPAPAFELSDWIELGGEPILEADPVTTEALVELVTPWTSESNGRADAVAARGDITQALSALRLVRARIAAVSPADAMAVMAWAGASGGAHGRRRGAAAGRFSAWWVLASVADLVDDWPADRDDMAVAAEDLQWFVWDGGEAHTGWQLNLAITDPQNDVSWAVMASDAAAD
ncbi:MAG: DUF6183 family protein [Actinomycetota bacterium]|nr:DUF6183 family protein [Actinomycetota bacterium]